MLSAVPRKMIRNPRPMSSGVHFETGKAIDSLRFSGGPVDVLRLNQIQELESARRTCYVNLHNNF